MKREWALASTIKNNACHLIKDYKKYVAHLYCFSTAQKSLHHLLQYHL